MNFIFTYDGFRLPNHVIQSIRVCKQYNPKSNVYLLANDELRVKNDLYDFCLIYRTNNNINKEIKIKLDKEYSSQKYTQNGFWFKSILRFFQIENFLKTNQLNIKDFIHLEADCLSFIDENMYKYIRKNYRKISCPKDIEGNCIPSVVYFPTTRSAVEFADFIKKRILTSKNLPKFYCNDIKMLNEYAARGGISFLSSSPLKNDSRIIFDPAFIGQYLFGKDIRHNKFKLKSGYIQIKKYEKVLKKSEFGIEKNETDKIFFILKYKNNTFKILNLHNYSKRHDIFDRKNQVEKIEFILRQIKNNQFEEKIMFSTLFWYIFDRLEYFVRIKINQLK